MGFQGCDDKGIWNARMFNDLSHVRSAALFLGSAVIYRYVCVASCWTLAVTIYKPIRFNTTFFLPTIGITVRPSACYCHHSV